MKNRDTKIKLNVPRYIRIKLHKGHINAEEKMKALIYMEKHSKLIKLQDIPEIKYIQR